MTIEIKAGLQPDIDAYWDSFNQVLFAMTKILGDHNISIQTADKSMRYVFTKEFESVEERDQLYEKIGSAPTNEKSQALKDVWKGIAR